MVHLPHSLPRERSCMRDWTGRTSKFRAAVVMMPQSLGEAGEHLWRRQSLAIHQARELIEVVASPIVDCDGAGSRRSLLSRTRMASSNSSFGKL